MVVGTKRGGLPNSEERTRTKAAPVGVTSSPVALPVSTADRDETEKDDHYRHTEGIPSTIATTAMARDTDVLLTSWVRDR